MSVAGIAGIAGTCLILLISVKKGLNPPSLLAFKDYKRTIGQR